MKHEQTEISRLAISFYAENLFVFFYDVSGTA